MKCRGDEEVAFPEACSLPLRRFGEIDDEAFTREDPATHERFQVAYRPLHGEVVEVDFGQMRCRKDH